VAEFQYAHALICIVRLLHVFKIKVEVQVELITVSKHSDADRKLFTRITGNTQHLLYPLLPPEREHHYTQSLRQHSDNFQLPDCKSALRQ